LNGDADFRNVDGSEAEFAILIGQHAQQSRGLGTRYAAMMHVAALRVLGFERVYATVIQLSKYQGWHDGTHPWQSQVCSPDTLISPAGASLPANKSRKCRSMAR
jgi:hypothetical protein